MSDMGDPQFQLDFAGYDPAAFAKPGDPDLVVDIDRISVAAVAAVCGLNEQVDPACPFDIPDTTPHTVVDMLVWFDGGEGAVRLTGQHDVAHFVDVALDVACRYPLYDGETPATTFDRGSDSYRERFDDWAANGTPLRFTAAPGRMGLLIPDDEIAWLALPADARIMFGVNGRP